MKSSEAIKFTKEFREITHHNATQAMMWSLFEELWGKVDKILLDNDATDQLKQNLFATITAWEADYLENKKREAMEMD